MISEFLFLIPAKKFDQRLKRNKYKVLKIRPRLSPFIEFTRV